MWIALIQCRSWYLKTRYSVSRFYIMQDDFDHSMMSGRLNIREREELKLYLLKGRTR